MAGESTTSPRRLKAAEKKRIALEMRKSGATFEQIGQELGLSIAGAYKAVHSALDKMLREPAEELRTLELERLDAMLAAIWAQVESGQHKAIDRALRIMDRRSKLLGLDMPVRADITSDGERIQAPVVYLPELEE